MQQQVYPRVQSIPHYNYRKDAAAASVAPLSASNRPNPWSFEMKDAAASVELVQKSKAKMIGNKI